MAKHTVASLAADLAAQTQVLNTYIALHQSLEAEVAALRAIKTVAPTTPRVRNVPNAQYAQACAARKSAMSRFMAEHPGARSATPADLAAYL